MMAIEYIHKTQTCFFIRERKSCQIAPKSLYCFQNTQTFNRIENNTFILKVSYKSQVYVFQDKNHMRKKHFV